jgi:hypothetical protein
VTREASLVSVEDQALTRHGRLVWSFMRAIHHVAAPGWAKTEHGNQSDWHKRISEIPNWAHCEIVTLALPARPLLLQWLVNKLLIGLPLFGGERSHTVAKRRGGEANRDQLLCHTVVRQEAQGMDGANRRLCASRLAR